MGCGQSAPNGYDERIFHELYRDRRDCSNCGQVVNYQHKIYFGRFGIYTYTSSFVTPPVLMKTKIIYWSLLYNKHAQIIIDDKKYTFESSGLLLYINGRFFDSLLNEIVPKSVGPNDCSYLPNYTAILKRDFEPQVFEEISFYHYGQGLTRSILTKELEAAPYKRELIYFANTTKPQFDVEHKSLLDMFKYYRFVPSDRPLSQIAFNLPIIEYGELIVRGELYVLCNHREHIYGYERGKFSGLRTKAAPRDN